jgi:hypothetical protein
MEEDTKKDQEVTENAFSYKGRWRGRKLWILICATTLAAVAVLFLIWALPSADNGGDAAVGADESEVGAEPAEESAEPGGVAEEQSQAPVEEPAGQDPTISPGTEAGAPDIVVNFPDPAEGGGEEPPTGGYTDAYGHWVLDMSGSEYGLTNCHIVLEESGVISAPPDYDQVFEIVASEFSWESGSPAFTATLQLILKLGSNQGSVPVAIELSGTVAPSFEEMGGDFIATPQGEAYAPYAQRGTFTMHR